MSEHLAPAGLLRDPLVPASYRTELDRLRAHLGQRILARGAHLAEEQPAWAKALGPVPGKETKAAEWYQVAAETEAYRNGYNIGGHETALIPKQYKDDPAAQQLIQRATALHKHGELTQVAHRTPVQIRQGADEAAIADRLSSDQAAARRVMDRMRAERAAASDPLPAPQQREAAVVDAITSTTAQATAATPTTQGVGQSPALADPSESTAAAIARALAKHRDDAEKASGRTPEPAPEQPPSGQSNDKKENTISESKDAARPTNQSSWWGEKQAEVTRRKRVTADKPTSTIAKEAAASAARKAAESADRSNGRSR